MTRTLLIRHARIDPGARICGTLDVPLSAEGRAAVAARLRRGPRRPPPDALYTSPLSRATGVAAPLGRAWGLAAREAAWAREINCGALEGMPFDEVRRRFPELWTRNQAERDESFTWPGGESYRGFRDRVMNGLAAIAAAHPGGRVAIVTHAGVVTQAIGVVRGWSAAVWSRDRPAPLTATEIGWSGTTPTAVLSFNDADWF